MCLYLSKLWTDKGKSESAYSPRQVQGPTARPHTSHTEPTHSSWSCCSCFPHLPKRTVSCCRVSPSVVSVLVGRDCLSDVYVACFWTHETPVPTRPANATRKPASSNEKCGEAELGYDDTHHWLLPLRFRCMETKIDVTMYLPRTVPSKWFGLAPNFPLDWKSMYSSTGVIEQDGSSVFLWGTCCHRISVPQLLTIFGINR